MNVSQLIEQAYYLSGLVGRGYQSITPDQSSDGLMLLNDVLAEKSITSQFIPYYTHKTIDTVVGQRTYYVNDLVNLAQLTFTLNNVVYEMIRMTQYEFWGKTKVIDVENLPFRYAAERELGKMRIDLYFLPDQVYTFNITGKYALVEVNLNDDLSNLLDRFYISYLKMLLAKRLCDYYGEQLNESILGSLQNIEAQLNTMQGIDLTMKKRSCFDNNGFSYAQINFGKGFYPGL